MLPILGPMKKLLYSRKFWLMVLDTVVSVVLFFYSDIPNVEFLVGAMQPVFIAIILAIAIEDAAEKSAG